MHSKIKGNIGEFAVAKHLAEKGYSVFREIGDLSKIDLIAEKDSKLIRIQVKAITEKNGKIDVYSKKSGPNYSFSYKEDMVDVFAIYVLNHNFVFFVSSKDVCAQAAILSFRLLSKPKRINQYGYRMVSDYLDFERALRDYTPDTQTSKVVGDEIVQTTTNESLAEEISE